MVRHRTLNATFASSNPAEATKIENNKTSKLKILLGEVAKWLNAADCKSVPSGSMVRIHLSPPLNILPRSQVVRHQTLTLTCVSSNLTEATI